MLGILHIPSTRTLIGQVYNHLDNGIDEITSAELLLLFSIFAGASVVYSPHHLGKMPAPHEGVQGDFAAYCRIAMALLGTAKPNSACTASLEGIVIMIDTRPC